LTKNRDVFDKAARLLDLESRTQASGAILETYASLPPLPPFIENPTPPLATALPDKSRLAFSFSGILTATARRITELRSVNVEAEAIKREISRVFQEAVVGHLCKKVGHAMISIDNGPGPGLGGLVVSGGVASNQYLRNTSVFPSFLSYLVF
jgi:N6-L-threonylcarbamoyladenine synthase